MLFLEDIATLLVLCKMYSLIQIGRLWKQQWKYIIFQKMITYKIPNSHQQLQLLCICDFCSTAQHDYNWAKVAPQVASWVRTITAECWFTQLYSGTRRWNVSQLCLIYACKIWQRFKGGRGIGTIWTENCFGFGSTFGVLCQISVHNGGLHANSGVLFITNQVIRYAWFRLLSGQHRFGYLYRINVNKLRHIS